MITNADSRDAIILEQVPLIAAPRFSRLPMMEASGHRYIVAADGLYLEVRRPWLRIRRQIAPSEAVLPYGEIVDYILYEFDDRQIQRLQAQFIRDARKQLPNEYAAWGVWNAHSQDLEYFPLAARSATPGSYNYECPRLPEWMSLAIDIHSHGHMQAFFSSTDDADDAGTVKVAVVVGNVDTDNPTIETRLCLPGLLIHQSAEV